MSDHHDSARRHFQALQQTDFLRLEHAAYLKGLLKPFKGKGALEDWANQCFALRDDMIGLAQRTNERLSLPPVGCGTGPTKHWRRHDLSALAQA